MIDVISELKEYGMAVDVHDPWVDAGEAKHEYALDLTSDPKTGTYDAVILAVAHEQFKGYGAAGFRALCGPDHVLYDLKYLLNADEVDMRL